MNNAISEKEEIIQEIKNYQLPVTHAQVLKGRNKEDDNDNLSNMTTSTNKSQDKKQRAKKKETEEITDVRNQVVNMIMMKIIVCSRRSRWQIGLMN